MPQNRVLPIVAALALCCSAFAQTPVPGQRGARVTPVVVNFSELAKQSTARRPVVEVEIESDLHHDTPRRLPPKYPRQAAPAVAAPAMVTPMPLAPPPSPTLTNNFPGEADDGGHIPPDTIGAVGPNHLVVTLNPGVLIQNRAGGTVSAVQGLNPFWAATGASNVFDPKIIYDPYGGRWIFTAASSAETASSSVLIGVTQTTDPTGTWNLYKFAADTSGKYWGDYPNVGFNKNWIVVTVNLFCVTSGCNPPSDFGGAEVFAFNKADLYSVPPPTITPTIFNSANVPNLALSGSLAPTFTYDPNLTTMYVVETFTGNPGNNQPGAIGVDTITGPVGSERYTSDAGTVSALNNATWDDNPPLGPPSGPPYVDFAPQLGTCTTSSENSDTSGKIQNGDDRVLFTIYRNGSLWVTQNAFLPAGGATHTAAQWWQFTPPSGPRGTDITPTQFGRVEDTTGATFYAYPSIAVNKQNDVMLGFSIFSATTYASAGYAFHASTDVAGSMRQASTFQSGMATYCKDFDHGSNRWGDFSGTAVDPANDLDFWTLQEYAAAQNGGISMWGTWWGHLVVKKRRGQTTSQ